MAQTKRLIFEVQDLEKSYGSYLALKIAKLDIHPGTIYGIVGTVGSGKSTLLNLLAGFDKQSSGSIHYDGEPFDTNWRGKIVQNEEIYYSVNPGLKLSTQTVSSYVSDRFHKKKNVIENRYFNTGSFRNLWDRRLNEISQGERHWLGMVLACETDPRVLLVDDYGVYFNTNMEKDFRNQLIKMNRNLGTTLILSSPLDVYLKSFASVLIYMDNGHISKIRSGNVRKPRSGNVRKHQKNNRRKR